MINIDIFHVFNPKVYAKKINWYKNCFNITVNFVFNSEPQFRLRTDGRHRYGTLSEKMENRSRATQVRGISAAYGQVSVFGDYIIN